VVPENTDLVAVLQTLPETDPVEIDGIQFGRGKTCQAKCQSVTVVVVQTVCVLAASCK
jgi:hypothetical protein